MPMLQPRPGFPASVPSGLRRGKPGSVPSGLRRGRPGSVPSGLRRGWLAGTSFLIGLVIAWLMSLGLGADDVGVLVFVVLATGWMVGVAGARRAWAWALLIYAGVIVGGAAWPPAPIPLDHPPSQPKPWVPPAAPVAIFALVGAFAGVLFRRVVNPVLDRVWPM